MKKADLLRAMAADKRRQAAAAWNPHIVRQCQELAKSYEHRAALEERKGATLYADDADYGDSIPQWPSRAAPDPRQRPRRARHGGGVTRPRFNEHPIHEPPFSNPPGLPRARPQTATAIPPRGGGPLLGPPLCCFAPRLRSLGSNNSI